MNISVNNSVNMASRATSCRESASDRLKPGPRAGVCRICGRRQHGKGLCLRHYMRDYMKTRRNGRGEAW